MIAIGALSIALNVGLWMPSGRFFSAVQLAAAPNIVQHVKTLLRDEFEVMHATVEIECVDCEAAC